MRWWVVPISWMHKICFMPVCPCPWAVCCTRGGRGAGPSWVHHQARRPAGPRTQTTLYSPTSSSFYDACSVHPCTAPTHSYTRTCTVSVYSLTDHPEEIWSFATACTHLAVDSCPAQAHLLCRDELWLGRPSSQLAVTSRSIACVITNLRAQLRRDRLPVEPARAHGAGQHGICLRAPCPEAPVSWRRRQVRRQPRARVEQRLMRAGAERGRGIF